MTYQYPDAVCSRCGHHGMNKEPGYWECPVCEARFYGGFDTDPKMTCIVCGHEHFKSQQQCPNCGLVSDE